MPTREEKPVIPPMREAVQELQTPVPTVVFYSERVNRDDPGYQAVAPIPRGTLYSTMRGADPKVIAQYPLLYFLRETRLGQTDRDVIWTWCNVPNAEDTYNAEIDYVCDDINSARYTRVYTQRRDDYEAGTFDPQYPGAVLGGLISINVSSAGTGYLPTDTVNITDATGTGAVAQLVVDSNGAVQSVVITNEGTNYSNPFATITSATGLGASLSPLIQSSNIVLVKQSKSEFPEDHPLRHEFVKVVRVYETLPGIFITTYRVDEDGKTITVQRRHNFQTVIDAIDPKETLVGGVWTRITSEPVNESYFVAWEVQESRTVPGNPVVSTKIDEDGEVITLTKTLKDTSTITSQEEITGGNWIRTYKEQVSDLVAYEVVESRPLPGNAIQSDKIDEDGMILSELRTLKAYSDIFPGEVINGGQWIKTEDKYVSDQVSWEIVTFRNIPGNPIPGTKVEESGDTVDIVRTLKDTTTIVTGETIAGTIWKKTYSREVSDLVSWEIVEALDLSEAVTVPSVKFNDKGEEIAVSKQLADGSTITPSQSESGGIITTVERGEVSDLVSEKITTDKEWLDEAVYEIKIADVIPEVFKAQIPTKTESHILSGTASMPSLATHEFEHSQRQLTKLLYEERIVMLDAPSLPVVVYNYGFTEKFGGKTTTTTLTLDTHGSLTVDTGLMIISSEVKDLGNGDDVKITEAGDEDGWYALSNTHVDEKFDLVVPFTKQVVIGGSTGGVSGGVYTEVKSIDVWRSLSIASRVDTTGWTDEGGGVLKKPDDAVWFAGMTYSFPPELTDALIDWATASCSCSSSFSADLIANMQQYHGPVKTRITEQFYFGIPPDDVSIDQFFPQSHNFGYAWWSACGTSDGTCRTKTGAPHFHIPLCLHGDLVLTIAAIVFTFPATTPSALPHGSYIMLPPHIERWRLGVFRRVLTEVLVP